MMMTWKDHSIAFFVLMGFCCLSSLSFAQARPTVIVSPMGGTHSQAVLESISTELASTDRVVLIGDPQVQKFIQKYASNQKPPTSEEALEFFEQGKASYQNLDMENALDFFRKAERLYKSTLWDEDSFSAYRTTKFSLSQAYLALQREEEARVELEQVILLDPDRSERRLSQKYYSPQVRDLFQKVLKDFEQRDVGDVSIQSQPSGATVYFDGKNVGQTPVSLKNIPVGQHYFLVRQSGYQETLHPQFVVKGTNRVQVDLSREVSKDVSRFFETVDDKEEISENRMNFLDDIGVALGGDIFLFLTPLSQKVKAQLFDQRSHELSPAVVGTSPKDLVNQLMQYIGEDGYIIGQSESASVEVQDLTSKKTAPLDKASTSNDGISYTPPEKPTSKEKSTGLLSKKWFWPVVGAVVIGAGAGIYFSGALDSGPSTSTLTTEVP